MYITMNYPIIVSITLQVPSASVDSDSSQSLSQTSASVPDEFSGVSIRVSLYTIHCC